MKPIGAFIGVAKGRLLPLSIPLRFFGAAVVFHLLAWAALAAGALLGQGFGEGLNWPLAALHLVTLGMLGMCALGAGAQLLPVATIQPAIGPRLLAAIWWLYTPGVALLALGMGMGQAPWLALGAAAVVLAMASWVLLIARHLRGARGMPGVVTHGWASLAALVLVLGSAIALVSVWIGWPGPGREASLGLHRITASYGFMGLLALGLSYILVPMFALADAPEARRQLLSGGLALLALILALLAPFIAATPMQVLAVIIGAIAAGLHLRLMAQALRTGMRQALGRSFVLIRVSWAGLLASLALGLLLVLQAPVPRLAQWFGLCLIGLWLMSFLLGILQRILPFLTAMHGGSGRRAHTPSSLSFDPALRVHFACHLAALALLALAFAADSRWLQLAAGLVGAVGALAFAVFYGVLLQRMGKPRR